jgi:hypothetical protein
VSQVRQLSGSFTVEVSLDRLVDEVAERVAARVVEWLREGGEDVAAATRALTAALELARIKTVESMPPSDEVLRGAEPDLPLTGGAHTSWPVGHHEAAEEA